MSHPESSSRLGLLTVNQMVLEFPSVLPVLARFGVDGCCGGTSTLDEVVHRHGIDGETLIEQLAVAIGEVIPTGVRS